jgi:FixJ family two-component response regulator
MQNSKSKLVWVLDSDTANLNAISRVAQHVGFEVHSFSDSQDFSAEFNEQITSACADGSACCIILNVSALHRIEVQHFSKALHDTPKIVIGAPQVSCELEQLARVGMFDFIALPFTLKRLQESLEAAFVYHARLLNSVQQVTQRFERLSKRELQVGAMVVQGLTNQAIAEQLDISIKTVKAHRAKVMTKTESNTLVELVRNYDNHARVNEKTQANYMRHHKRTSN